MKHWEIMLSDPKQSSKQIQKTNVCANSLQSYKNNQHFDTPKTFKLLDLITCFIKDRAYYAILVFDIHETIPLLIIHDAISDLIF